MYEDEWETSNGLMSLLKISSCMFFLITCFGGMRGFEAVWTNLAGLRFDICFMEDTDDFTGIGWPIVGRFKAEGGGEGCHVIPIAGITGSGVHIFEWTQRFVGRLDEMNIRESWVFRREDGSCAKAFDYCDKIFTKLEDIQKRTNLIESNIEVYEAYGIQQSGRRFFNSECQNQNVKKSDI